MTHPPYIIFEGIDGCGKNSQSDLLAEHWRSQGLDPLQVNEPDEELPTGKLLRQLLKSGEYPETHAPLFVADRMALLTQKVKPALAAGRPVISARSFLSTLVYQQENWPFEWLCHLHDQLPVQATGIIVLDVDPQVGLDRVTSRGGHKEVYEKLETQKRNRQRYLELVELQEHHLRPYLAPGGFAVICPSVGTPKEVHQNVLNSLGLQK